MAGVLLGLPNEILQGNIQILLVTREIVNVFFVGRPKPACSKRIYSLQYDSILGTFNADVKVVGDDAISVDGKVIKVVSNRDPTKLPWG